MSIVRVGLAETKKFSEGYEAIFGRKGARQEAAGARAKKGAARTARKKGKKGKR